MKAGETQRFQCNDCNREFEVILEPKAKNMKPEDRPKEEGNVGACPFDDCGSSDIEKLD
jgi:hypothetical protein